MISNQLWISKHELERALQALYIAIHFPHNNFGNTWKSMSRQDKLLIATNDDIQSIQLQYQFRIPLEEEVHLQDKKMKTWNNCAWFHLPNFVFFVVFTFCPCPSPRRS